MRSGSITELTKDFGCEGLSFETFSTHEEDST